jgi:ferrous iron transport protein B
MWTVFQFAFSISAPFSTAIDILFSSGSEWSKTIIQNEVLASLIGDGIFGGLGFILVFLPPIAFVFIALAILEDTGYLPRAAFVMDRAMTKVGLHGKSFIPMLLGFGCNVPAIMGCRTIENEADRKITIMVNPLMSCSARLPVYVLFAGAFFAGYEGFAITSMYLLGIVLAAIMATVIRKLFFGGEPSPLLMEIPDYSMPTLKNILTSAWIRVKIFLKKAATILFAGAIIIWFLSVFPWDATNGGEILENSYAASIGHAIEPVIAPLGFDWKAGVALFTGFVAKELVVGTLGILYGVESEEAIAEAIAVDFNPATALALMAITLIYLPCLAALGVLVRELGELKWVGLVIAYELLLAYIVAAIIVAIGGVIL